MPLYEYTPDDARRNMKENHFHRWSMRERNKNNNENLGVNRIDKDKLEVNLSNPKFKIKEEEAVFTIGSCFAREIEDNLIKKSFNVLTRKPRFENLYLFNSVAPNLRRTAFLNRFNTGSMLEEIRFLLELENSSLSKEKLLYKVDKRSWVDLHYSPVFKTLSLQEGLARRKIIQEELSCLKTAGLIIITLGLIEAWKDLSVNAYLNVVPGPRVIKKYGKDLRLDVLSFEDNLFHLDEMYDILMKHCRSDIKIIITVSPVPLEVTFSKDDVLVANMRSKSILRSVAETFAANKDNVDYFPSYEIACLSSYDQSWEWDGRHVKPRRVEHIINQFLNAYID